MQNAPISPLLPASAPLAQRAARVILRLAQGLRNHNALYAAPAMAFHFFLSLIPVLVLAGFILGQLVRQRGVEALVGPLLDAIPEASQAVVRHELERLAGAHVAPLAPLSVIGFLWVASSGVHGSMDVVEVAVGAPRRSWARQRAVALAWLVASLTAMAALAWGLVRLDAIVHHDAEVRARAAANAGAPMPSPSVAAHRPKSEHDALTELPREARPHRRGPVFGAHATWERAVALGSLFLVALGALAAFYRFAVEHPEGLARHAWPGAFVAFFAWVLVSWAFGAYVSSLGDYALFYGSVAAVAVLLVWFYLTSWSLLLGAEVNAQLEGHRDRRQRRTKAA